jgi:hypothetical protein
VPKWAGMTGLEPRPKHGPSANVSIGPCSDQAEISVLRADPFSTVHLGSYPAEEAVVFRSPRSRFLRAETDSAHINN